jgi:hypothetical protein
MTFSAAYGRVLLLLLGSGFHHRLQPVQRGLKLLGIANAIQKHWTRIEREKAAKIAVSFRQGRASRRASRRSFAWTDRKQSLSQTTVSLSTWARVVFKGRDIAPIWEVPIDGG